MKFLKGAFLATLLATGSAWAQAFQYDDVDPHDSGLYPAYYFTQIGQGPYSFPTYSFFFTATGGTGSAAALNGNDYIGFSVTPFFDDIASGESATLSASASSLSYNLGTGNLWAVDPTDKINAISNILSYYATELRTTDPDSQDYANLAAGINLALFEIVVDYDGTIGSINLNAGNALEKADAEGTPITSSAALDTYNYIRANLIGTGTGGATPIYIGKAPGDTYVSTVFIPVVPEPGTLALTGLGAGVLLLRLRRHLRR